MRFNPTVRTPKFGFGYAIFHCLLGAASVFIAVTPIYLYTEYNKEPIIVPGLYEVERKVDKVLICYHILRLFLMKASKILIDGMKGPCWTSNSRPPKTSNELYAIVEHD